MMIFNVTECELLHISSIKEIISGLNISTSIPKCQYIFWFSLFPHPPKSGNFKNVIGILKNRKTSIDIE